MPKARSREVGILIPLFGLLVIAVLAAIRDRYWVTAAMIFAFIVYGIATISIMRRNAKKRAGG